jgi:Recombinase
MSQSNAERQRLWRERQKQAGYRAMVVWLPPEAVDILTRYPERERGQVILSALRNATSNTPVTIPGNEGADTGPPALLDRLEALEGKVESLTAAVQGLVTGNAQVTLPSNTPVTIPGDSQVTLQGNNAHPPAKAKAPSAEELAQAAQSLHKQGLSYAQIAARWEKEKVPTLKGGRWHKGTISNLVQRYVGRV